MGAPIELLVAGTTTTSFGLGHMCAMTCLKSDRNKE